MKYTVLSYKRKGLFQADLLLVGVAQFCRVVRPPDVRAYPFPRIESTDAPKHQCHKSSNLIHSDIVIMYRTIHIAMEPPYITQHMLQLFRLICLF